MTPQHSLGGDLSQSRPQQDLCQHTLVLFTSTRQEETSLGDSSLRFLVGAVVHGGVGCGSLAAAHTAWQLAVVEERSAHALTGRGGGLLLGLS